jgi:hypothetical protein
MERWCFNWLAVVDASGNLGFPAIPLDIFGGKERKRKVIVTAEPFHCRDPL